MVKKKKSVNKHLVEDEGKKKCVRDKRSVRKTPGEGGNGALDGGRGGVLGANQGSKAVGKEVKGQKGSMTVWG